MFRFFLLSVFLIISIDARENPFFASKGEKDITYSSNEKRDKAPLKQATITLPNQARILQKVTLEYKNLDGSIEKKSIELDNTVDWHLPVFISQSYKNNEKTINEIIKPSKIKKKKFKKIASIKYVDFYALERTLKIITKDKKIRDFLLTDPHRIVVDFQRESKMKSYTKINKNNIFAKVRIGNHKDYYRAVIELDGLYRYTMKKIDNGYLINLK